MYKLLIIALVLALSGCATAKKPKVTKNAPDKMKVQGAVEYCKRKPESPLCQKS